MSAIVLIGAQWGDEGKGKVVDLCAESADMVVRFSGGPNAGHTLIVGDQKLVLRLLPSGILHAHSECVLAQGTAVDPSVLCAEMRALEEQGHGFLGRLFLSERAHLILPYHPMIDALREGAGDGRLKIGTTKRGIGPCYEDKVGRRGVRAGDLRDLNRVRALVGDALKAWAPLAESLGSELPSADSVMDWLSPFVPVLVPLLADTSQRIDGAIRQKKRVLFEGAQGTLLDIDMGTYPYVTSSSAVAAGACTGSGIGPTRIRRVLGVTKAYATRVGEGPFPTELHDEMGELLRTKGGEFGSVTGRPRRTGWLDLPALRYAIRANGLDALAMTKLDVLTGIPFINVCTEYETSAGRTGEFPAEVGQAGAKPVFLRLPGWEEPIGHARSMDELPVAARAYVDTIEKLADIPIEMISVGPKRDETIVLRNIFEV